MTMAKRKPQQRKEKAASAHSSGRPKSAHHRGNAAGPRTGGGKSTSGVLQARPPNNAEFSRRNQRSLSTGNPNANDGMDIDDVLDDVLDDLNSSDTAELTRFIKNMKHPDKARPKRPVLTEETPQKGKNKKKNRNTSKAHSSSRNLYESLADSEDADDKEGSEDNEASEDDDYEEAQSGAEHSGNTAGSNDDDEASDDHTPVHACAADATDADEGASAGDVDSLGSDDDDASVIFVEPRLEYRTNPTAVATPPTIPGITTPPSAVAFSPAFLAVTSPRSKNTAADEEAEESDGSYQPSRERDVPLQHDAAVKSPEIADLHHDAKATLGIDPVHLASARLSRSDKAYSVAAAEGVTPNPDGSVMFDDILNRFKSIRYKAIVSISDPDHIKKEVAKVLKSSLKIIQDEGGTAIHLAAWDSKKVSTTFATPAKLPSGDGSKKDDLLFQTLLGAVPKKPKGKKKVVELWINLHFVTASPDALAIPLPDLGLHFHEDLATVGLQITKSPHHMQCARHSSLIWLLYSNQSMDADKVCDELREQLRLKPSTVIGAQWRRIKQPNGKMYDFPDPDDRNKDPPPQALHIDCDSSARLSLMKALMKRFRKRSRHRLLGQKVRAIPCFGSHKGPTLKRAKARPGAKEPPAATMVSCAIKQRYFVNTYLIRLPCPELVNADFALPDSDGNIFTAATWIMSQHPPDQITARMCTGVMPHWRDEGHILLTSEQQVEHMENFMASMIPQSLYVFGSSAARWWSPDALEHHAEDAWDPRQGLTLTDAMYEDFDSDDPYGMKDAWKSATMANAFSPTAQEESPTGTPAPPGATVGEMLANRDALANDDQSLGTYIGRDHDGDTVMTEIPPAPDPASNTKVAFDNLPAAIGTTSGLRDAASVSTMGSGFTTESTRKNLRHERLVSAQLREENQEVEAERDAALNQIDALRAMLHAAGFSEEAIDAKLMHSSPAATAPTDGALAVGTTVNGARQENE